MKRKITIVTGVLCCALLLIACGREKGKDGKEPVEPTLSVAPSMEPKDETPKPTPTPTKTPSKAPTATPRPLNELITGEAWELGNLAGNLTFCGFICEADGKVYYRDMNHDGYLCRSNPDGTDKEILLEERIRAIQVVGDYVYYISNPITGDTNQIQRIKKNGGAPSVLLDEGVSSMLVTEDRIYFAQAGKIAKMNIDGTQRVVLAEIEGMDSAWLTAYGDVLITGGVKLMVKGFRLFAVKLDGSGYSLIDGYGGFPVVNEDKLWYQGQEGTVAISLKTGEKKIWDVWGRVATLYDGIVYLSSDSRLSYVNETTGECGVLYPEDYRERGLYYQVEKYGIACGRLYFGENDGKQGSEMVLKSYNLETGEISIVP